MKTLKKISLAVMLLGLMFILMIGLGTTASAATSGKLKYEVSDGEAIITGFSLTAFTKPKEVEIPDTINDYPVTAIADNAFEDESITSVIIPDSVITIGDYAFDECEKLASVTLGNSVESIGEYAFRNCNDITILTIPESVKSIGNCAFSECSDFTNIYWNAKNAEIGYDVFANAGRNGTGIDVVFGNNVEKIPSYIFTASSNIKSITIGNSVKTIADYAFNCSVQNGSINIPESVTSIGNCALSGFYSAVTINNPECEIYNSEGTLGYGATIYGCCGSTAQKYADNYKRTFVGIGHYYKSKVTEPICTEKGYTTYICACGDSYVADYTSPAHVNNNSDMYCDLCGEMIIDIFEYSIDDNEVSITGFDSSIGGYIVIPETIEGYPVTSIRGMAFQMCFDVKTVIIPESVTTIEAFSFCLGIERIAIFNKDCDIWDMTDVFASQTTIYGYEGSTAQEYAEKYDRTFINIENSGIENPILQYLSYRIEDGEVTITDFDKNFSGDVVIPEKIDGYPVTAFDDWVFRDCSFISVTIPGSIISIGEEAFADCRDLEKVTIGNGVTSIGNRAFWHCESLKSVTIPGSVINIGEEAFVECRALETVTIENGVTSIGNRAFLSCESLTNVTIPGSVISIGEYAFHNCKALETVTIENGVTSISSFAFDDCTSLTSITIPDSVTSIGRGAFYNCESLTSITIPGSVTSIGNAAFKYCESLTTIAVDENNKNYLSDEYGVLFNKDKTILIQYPIGNERTSYVIPDSVTSISDGVFAGCSKLTSITIPDSVTIIGDSAFGGCTSLTSITIPDSVTSIGPLAFQFCDSLTNITLPDSVTRIGSHAFYNCTSLTNITIPNGVKSIGNSAFFNCTSLASITIPDSVTSIGNYTFYNCTSLTSITIPDGVTSIGNSAFDYCSSLTGITIKNPGCEIYDSEHTIDPVATIYGYSGSTAQEYAEKYGRNFVAISHEHSYTSKVTAPTCTAKGYTTYTCACGDSYKSNYKNANGHSYAAATCTKAKTCTVCGVTSGKSNGHKYTNNCDTSCNTCKATRKITHSYKNVVTKATLTKNGKIENKCSVCGKVKSTKAIAYAKTFALSETKFTYNGKVKTPFVTIVDSNGKALVNGTDYTVKYASGRKNVGQYTVTITMKGNYSGTKTLTFNILPGKTSKITATQTTTTLKATWNKVTGATGYKVELLNANGKVIKTVTTKNLTYTFTKLTAGTTYKVRVTAYKTISGKNQYSLVSTTITTATKPATPTLKVTSTKKGVANFTWTNVAGENGYEVYYSTSKSSGFKSLASYKTNVAKGSKSKLTSGKTYYFKVRSFKKVGNTTVYGDWSKVVSVKVK